MKEKIKHQINDIEKTPRSSQVINYLLIICTVTLVIIMIRYIQALK